MIVRKFRNLTQIALGANVFSIASLFSLEPIHSLAGDVIQEFFHGSTLASMPADISVADYDTGEPA